MARKAGRPMGAIDKKNSVPRDHTCTQFRCSRGLNETIKELVKLGIYKSKADVMHEAIAVLAARKLPATFYWYNKIQ